MSFGGRHGRFKTEERKDHGGRYEGVRGVLREGQLRGL